jgi:hypothetical protein
LAIRVANSFGANTHFRRFTTRSRHQPLRKSGVGSRRARVEQNEARI